MWESIKQFFIDNESSIIVSLIIGAIFFILGPLGLWFSGKKVKREKINKAKAEFLDLIESMLVNNENFSRSKILTLFRAIERQNGINLELDSDIENLLEDLSLRFARSKHLSAEQKDNYATKIDDLIKGLNQIPDKEASETSILRQREIPKSIKSIIADLKSASEKLDSEKLNETIERLEKYHKRPNDPIFLTVRRIMEKPRFFFAVLVVYVIIIALVVYFDGLK